MGENNFSDNRFLIRKHGVQEKVAQHFSSSEGKELSSQNSIVSKNITQK